ncbi:inositol monophosphatase family protein [Ruegeria lacuscaerulensis]|uniref:inositol monophosphatase family protein n=1 Tax=Ruegeria lacuscaerulensis TaxID=55218 RepID=UPI00147FCB43|nr:inositol monophosphatase family protein [Ruegeria lacuscaerulensis]
MNSKIDIHSRANFAIKLAQEAGDLAVRIRASRGDNLSVSNKGEQDFVTEADMAVEDFIRSEIGKAFPEDVVLGEERGGDSLAERAWVIDPIDGTTNFIRLLPDWGVSIAYCIAGNPVCAAIAAPDLDILADAELGGGARVNGQTTRVSDVAELSNSLFIVGRSQRTDFEDYLSALRTLINSGAEYRRHGSAALGLVNVAMGISDCYYEAHINSWDAMAGVLLVREAGGVVECDEPRQFLEMGSVIYASNAHLGSFFKSLTPNSSAE